MKNQQQEVSPAWVPYSDVDVRLVYDIKLVTGRGEIAIHFNGISDFPDVVHPVLGCEMMMYIPQYLESVLLRNFTSRLRHYVIQHTENVVKKMYANNGQAATAAPGVEPKPAKELFNFGSPRMDEPGEKPAPPQSQKAA